MGKFLQDLCADLVLYVRHCAWLNTTPDKDERDKSKTKPVSRREAFKQRGNEDPALPPCDAQHLVAYLFEMGPTVPAGMGEGPVTHSEIADWQDNTGIELDAWEARTLRRMSQEYVAETHRAKDRNCKPPWADCPEASPASNAEDVRAAIRTLAQL